VSQSANTFLAGPAEGLATTPDWRLLVVADIPTLPESKIQTTNNNRMLLTAGNTIVESAALTNGQFLVGSTGLPPVVTSLTAGQAVSVTNGPGSITLDVDISGFSTCSTPLGAQCIPQALSLTTLAVSQSTFLGTNTSCMSPLLPSCYDISSQSCMSGPLDNNCLPSNPTFGIITASQLILLNDTIINAQVEDQFTLSVGELSVNQTLTLDADATMICEVSFSYISYVLTHKRGGSTPSVKTASPLLAKRAHWAFHCPNHAFQTPWSFTTRA
jgi:hypothetical protein